MSRQIVLDTETTGLDPRSGDRIIEVGCVELENRRLTGSNLHLYIQPDREVGAEAIAVHGITNEFLVDKPRFADIASTLRDYIAGAELVIHNAAFDVGFIEHEFRLLGEPIDLASHCRVTDSLAMARKQFPGQRNNLDALCKRLGINNGHRTLHGALLDAEILADVYLAMTGGQESLILDMASADEVQVTDITDMIDTRRIRVVQASADEQQAHEHWLARLRDEGHCVWDLLPPAGSRTS